MLRAALAWAKATVAVIFKALVEAIRAAVAVGVVAVHKVRFSRSGAVRHTGLCLHLLPPAVCGAVCGACVVAGEECGCEERVLLGSGVGKRVLHVAVHRIRRQRCPSCRPLLLLCPRRRLAGHGLGPGVGALALPISVAVNIRLGLLVVVVLCSAACVGR